MAARAFVLSEIEDASVAACDDQYLSAKGLLFVLRSYFSRQIPVRELRRALGHLAELDLLRVYVMHNSRITLTRLPGNRTEALLVRATQKGRVYLRWRRVVV